MPKIKVQATTVVERCQSQTSDNFRRSKGYADTAMRCKRRSLFSVGAVFFCRSHAAEAVFVHVLEGREVEKC